jgi:[ribosomal protein S18]-alanine N-acetyltransferase
MSVLERLLRRDGPGTALGELRVAPMRRRDLRRGVMPIESVSYPRPWSQSVFESEISQMRSGTRCYLVARRLPDAAASFRHAPVVGYAGLWFAADEAHVTNVAVAPNEQRQGVASTLLLGLADEAIRRGCTAWTLEVRVSSTGAQELYRRFGFAPAGVRTRYYENTEDAIVMWCHGIQSPDYAALLDTIRGELTHDGPISDRCRE